MALSPNSCQRLLNFVTTVSHMAEVITNAAKDVMGMGNNEPRAVADDGDRGQPTSENTDQIVEIEIQKVIAASTDSSESDVRALLTPIPEEDVILLEGTKSNETSLLESGDGDGQNRLEEDNSGGRGQSDLHVSYDQSVAELTDEGDDADVQGEESRRSESPDSQRELNGIPLSRVPFAQPAAATNTTASSIMFQPCKMSTHVITDSYCCTEYEAYIGQKANVFTKSHMRYCGEIFNCTDDSITLKNAKCHGTEHRGPVFVEAMDLVYESVVIGMAGTEIKILPGMAMDPDVLQVNGIPTRKSGNGNFKGARQTRNSWKNADFSCSSSPGFDADVQIIGTETARCSIEDEDDLSVEEDRFLHRSILKAECHKSTGHLKKGEWEKIRAAYNERFHKNTTTATLKNRKAELMERYGSHGTDWNK